MPIIAARPLLSSMARLRSLVSSEKVSQPKSRAPLRKSPGNSASPVTVRIGMINEKIVGELFVVVEGYITWHCAIGRPLFCVAVHVSQSKVEKCLKRLTILHDEKLKKANEKDDLSKAGLGDGVRAGDGGKTIGEGVEGVTGEVDVAGKVDAGAGDDLAEEGKLGDTAVLELDVTKALEAGLISIVEEAEGIIEAEGLLGTELFCGEVEVGNKVGSTKLSKIAIQQNMIRPTPIVPLSVYCATIDYSPARVTTRVKFLVAFPSLPFLSVPIERRRCNFLPCSFFESPGK